MKATEAPEPGRHRRDVPTDSWSAAKHEAFECPRCFPAAYATQHARHRATRRAA